MVEHPVKAKYMTLSVWRYSFFFVCLGVWVWGCSPTTKPDCRDAKDCGPAQVCRLGLCVQKEVQERDGEEPTFSEPRPEPKLEPEPALETTDVENSDGGSAREVVQEQPPTEALGCKTNERRPCYTGEKGSQDVGECRTGIQFCDAEGKWGPCNREVTPKAEVCDGKDNDCDGRVDEDLKSTPCIKQQGVCKGAMQRCAGEKGWRLCEVTDYQKHNAAYELLEKSCDGKDNDCDGVIDALAYTETCTVSSQTSDCSKGHKVCDKGQAVCRPIYQQQPAEICGNQIDDNCDGQVDETSSCQTLVLPAKPSDYSVASDGSVLITSLLPGRKANIVCAKPDGTTIKVLNTQNLDPLQDSQLVQNIAVHGTWFLPQSGRHLVFWSYSLKAPKAPLPTRHYFQFFDATCKPLGTRQSIASTKILDIAIAPNDVFVVAHAPKEGVVELLRFDKTGKPTSTSLSLLPAQGADCLKTSVATYLKVAINTKGQGVVACYKSDLSGSVFFRRFQANSLTFTDSQYQLEQASKSGASGTLALSINSQGEFHLSWNKKSSRDRYHTFHNASGQRQKLVLLPSGIYGVIRPDILGNDFVWGNEDKQVWYRYNPKGVELRRVYAKYSMLRFSPSGVVYGIQRKASFVLHTRFLSLSGKAPSYVCHPYTQRDCSSEGFLSKLSPPCKAGRQICRGDGQGWSLCQGEVLRVAEQCNDQKDNDCDGKVDEDCTNFSVVGPPDLHAFEVAFDGSVVSVYWNGSTLIGNCYRPDRSIRRGAITISQPLAQPTASAVSFSLRMAYTSKHFLVTWSEQISTGVGERVMSRLYDKDCLPVTPAFEWPTQHTYQAGSGLRLHSTAIDHNGNFALLGRDLERKYLYLHLYNNKGVQQGKDLAVDPQGAHCHNSHPRVALHPTNQTGLVLCLRGALGKLSSGLSIRRFHLTKGFLSPAPVSLPSFTSKLFVGFVPLVNINAQDELAVRWQDRDNLYLSSYDASTKHLNTVKYAALSLRKAVAVSNHAQLLRWDNDFVVSFAPRNSHNDSGTQAHWYRYTSRGQLVNKASVSNTTKNHWLFTEWRDSFRRSANKVFLQKGKTIQIDTVSFR